MQPSRGQPPRAKRRIKNSSHAAGCRPSAVVVTTTALRNACPVPPAPGLASTAVVARATVAPEVVVAPRGAPGINDLVSVARVCSLHSEMARGLEVEGRVRVERITCARHRVGRSAPARGSDKAAAAQMTLPRARAVVSWGAQAAGEQTHRGRRHGRLRSRGPSSEC